MPEPSIALADAITEAINGKADWSLEFTARRLFLPKWTPADLSTLRVSVVPREKRVQSLDRAAFDLETLDCEIGVQRKLTSLDPEAIDPLIDFVDELETWLRGQAMTVDGTPATWIGTEYLVSQYPDHLARLIFTTSFSLTYQYPRAR